MISTLLSTIGLGVAGIDPVGAILLMTAVSTGVSKIKIIAFTVSVFLASTVISTLISVLGTNIIKNISNSFPQGHSVFWAYADVVLVLVLSVWLVRQYTKKEPKDSGNKKRKMIRGSAGVFMAAGVVFGVTSVLDPTFIANTTLAAQAGSIYQVVVMQSLWILISQCMLVGVALAFMLGLSDRLIAWASTLWARHRLFLKNAVLVSGVVAVFAITFDLLHFVVKGTYIFS
jgi:hypothetical protein